MVKFLNLISKAYYQKLLQLIIKRNKLLDGADEEFL